MTDFDPAAHAQPEEVAAPRPMDVPMPEDVDASDAEDAEDADDAIETAEVVIDEAEEDVAELDELETKPDEPDADSDDESDADVDDEPAADIDDDSDDDPDSAPILSAKPDLDALRKRMICLQQQLRELHIPVVVVLEGWSAAGKGMMLGELLQGLDPRGYQVHVGYTPYDDDYPYPRMRRYWRSMPAGGQIALFCGGWYRELKGAKGEGKEGRARVQGFLDEIIQMESQLVCNGTLILKFFLNISRKEQKRRLKLLESKKSTAWRVSKDDWKQNKDYDENMQRFNALISRTHMDGAPWIVVQSQARDVCRLKLYQTLLDAFQRAIDERRAGARLWDAPKLPHVKPIQTIATRSLSDYDLDRVVQGDYKEQIDAAQKKLRKLQNEMYLRGIPTVLGFEGWDAAGKGGAIRRLSSALDARSTAVIPICAPTETEKSHHHLWRFWNTLPEDGHVAIYDRTWYGRVMVERVEGFCTENQWKRAYEEINQFERELTSHGAVVRKFWLQIDPDEQLRRFHARQTDPEKQYKITDEDWRNREKWPLYEVAVDEMLQKTNTAQAPWVVVEANDKPFARLKVLNAVIDAMERALS